MFEEVATNVISQLFIWIAQEYYCDEFDEFDM